MVSLKVGSYHTTFVPRRLPPKIHRYTTWYWILQAGQGCILSWWYYYNYKVQGVCLLMYNYNNLCVSSMWQSQNLIVYHLLQLVVLLFDLYFITWKKPPWPLKKPMTPKPQWRNTSLPLNPKKKLAGRGSNASYGIQKHRSVWEELPVVGVSNVLRSYTYC